ncbi:MAG: transporter [Desulfobacterales bacterium]|nr:transporter [Desulfobacterales bacterium]
MNQRHMDRPTLAAKWLFTLFAVIGSALLAGFAAAEEGGSGHYLPGSMASFVDGVPLKETFIVRANVVNYNGNINASKPIPIGGRTTLGADVTSWAYGLSLLWRPPLEIGKDWSYAMSATIPYIMMDVSADVEATAGSVSSAVSRSSRTLNGLGDIVLMPLMLELQRRPRLQRELPSRGLCADRKLQGRAPGQHGQELDRRAGARAHVFRAENGFEASAFFGADFNTENEDTDYQSGTQVHVDGMLAQHFPLFGDLAGAGVSAYYYKQVTADSGDGATPATSARRSASALSPCTRPASGATTRFSSSSGCMKSRRRTGSRATSFGLKSSSSSDCSLGNSASFGKNEHHLRRGFYETDTPQAHGHHRAAIDIIGGPDSSASNGVGASAGLAAAAQAGDGSVLPFPPTPSASVAAPTIAGIQASAARGAEPLCRRTRRTCSSSCSTTSASASADTFGGDDPYADAEHASRARASATTPSTPRRSARRRARRC